MSTSKFVVILDSEPIAIGPFKTLEEASSYKESDMECANMRTMEIVPPARNWKKLKREADVYIRPLASTSPRTASFFQLRFKR